jgi:hypothetical protein
MPPGIPMKSQNFRAALVGPRLILKGHAITGKCAGQNSQSQLETTAFRYLYQKLLALDIQRVTEEPYHTTSWQTG